MTDAMDGENHLTFLISSLSAQAVQCYKLLLTSQHHHQSGLELTPLSMSINVQDNSVLVKLAFILAISTLLSTRVAYKL